MYCVILAAGFGTRMGELTKDCPKPMLQINGRPHDKNKGLVNTGAYVLSKKYFSAQMVKISEKEYGSPQTLMSMYPKNKTHVVSTHKW